MSDELTTIRSRIKARLDTITGLANYAQEPDAIPSVPFTILGSAEIDYDTDMGGGRNFSFRLFVAVAERDSQNAWSTLDGFLAVSGSTSLKAAIEGSSGPAPKVGDYAQVIRAEHAGHTEYRKREFIGAELVIKTVSGG